MAEDKLKTSFIYWYSNERGGMKKLYFWQNIRFCLKDVIFFKFWMAKLEWLVFFFKLFPGFLKINIFVYIFKWKKYASALGRKLPRARL